MNYKRYILWMILIIVVFISSSIFFHEAKGKERIEEEAIPIRENEIIIGMNYTITIGEFVRETSFTISTHILDSIVHYKDLDTIDDFFIQLVMDDQSSSHYKVKNIYVIDTSIQLFVEDISYSKGEKDDCFFLFFTKDFFEHYRSNYQIQIELEK